MHNANANIKGTLISPTIQLSKNHFIHTYHLVTLYLSIENFEKFQHKIYPYLGMLIL